MQRETSYWHSISYDMQTTQRMYAKKPMNLMRDAMKQAARKTTTA